MSYLDIDRNRIKFLPLFCRHPDCKGNSTSQSKNKSLKVWGSYVYEGKVIDGKIISAGLTRHLNGSLHCKHKYFEDDLLLSLISAVRGDYNFSSSMPYPLPCSRSSDRVYFRLLKIKSINYRISLLE